MIETYPYFLLKNGEPFRFQFHIDKEHTIVTLPSKGSDDLLWNDEKLLIQTLVDQGKKILIQFDFGLEKGFGPLFEKDVNAFILSVEEFNKNIFKNFSNSIEGVIFFNGSVFFEKRSLLEEAEVSELVSDNLKNVFDPERLKRLALANLLGSLLHRLVSFLDDRLPAFVIFDDACELEPVDRAIFLSKERFDHLFVSAPFLGFQYTTLDLDQGVSSLGYLSMQSQEQPSDIRIGLLLPSDENIDVASYEKINSKIISLIKEKNSFRIICEKIFNECWNEIDEVMYSQANTHPMTLRMIKGFEASGGIANQF